MREAKRLKLYDEERAAAEKREIKRRPPRPSSDVASVSQPPPKVPPRRRVGDPLEQIPLGEAEDLRGLLGEVEVDLIVGGLNREAWDEADGAERDNEEAGASGGVDVLHSNLFTTGHDSGEGGRVSRGALA